MRVLLVIEPSGGGSGRHVIDLAGGLIRRGHEVSLIYSPTRAEAGFVREATALPLRALRSLPMRRGVGPGDIGSLLRLRRLARALGSFDIVHGHSAKAGALARLAAPAGAARVYTPHALPGLARHNPLRRAHALAECALAHTVSDAVIAVSSDEAAHARRWRFPAERLHTIVNGVTPAPSISAGRVRSELGLADDAFVVGFVGRLCAQKDPVRWAAAVEHAARHNARIVGVVVGDGPLAAHVQSAGGSAVRLLGARPARQLLPAFDLLVGASRYEAMPYVLIEAATAGVPFLTTAVGGAADLLSAGAHGQALPLDASPEQIGNAILAHAEDRRGAIASPLASERFSLDRMVEETEVVYRQAARRRCGGR